MSPAATKAPKAEKALPVITNPPFEFEAYSIIPKGNLWCIRTMRVQGDRIMECSDNVEDLRSIQAAKLSNILGVGRVL